MKWHISHITFLVLFLFLINHAFTDRHSKPFYVIGHMANKVSDIRSFLKLGANGIETDVYFTYDGSPTLNYHGFPCDCWRYCFWKERFPDYLNYVRIVRTPGSPVYEHQFVLLYFDLKIDRLSRSTLKKAGELLAINFIVHLFGKDVEIPWIILGIPDIIHLGAIKSFQATLEWNGYGYMLERIGYDVYNSLNKPETILWALHKANITHHVWLGEGLTNCFSPDYNRLRNLVHLRDVGIYTHGNLIWPDAVYHWTIDTTKHIRLSLEADVNGIVTNSPENVRQVLKEPQFKNRYSLAMMEDVPWNPTAILSNSNTFWYTHW